MGHNIHPRTKVRPSQDQLEDSRHEDQLLQPPCGRNDSFPKVTGTSSQADCSQRVNKKKAGTGKLPAISHQEKTENTRAGCQIPLSAIYVRILRKPDPSDPAGKRLEQNTKDFTDPGPAGKRF